MVKVKPNVVDQDSELRTTRGDINMDQARPAAEDNVSGRDNADVVADIKYPDPPKTPPSS